MNDYLSALEAILFWYGIIGIVLYLLTMIGRLKIESPITKTHFLAIWLLCLFFTAAPLLFSAAEDTLTKAAYDCLLLFGSLASWTVAKSLLLAITLKRALVCDQGRCLFVVYFLLLLLGESFHLSIFPIFAALSVLWLFVPSKTVRKSSLLSP